MLNANTVSATPAGVDSNQSIANLATDNSENNKESETASKSFFSVVRRYASLSDALRLFGALAVAAAMGLYLIDGIQAVNGIYRFLTMLGVAASLTAAGLLMSSLLKEQRGSRVFISLGLLSVPVNLTVFSALIYSVFQPDSAAGSYPGFANWQVVNASEILLSLIAGIAVLLPITWLGFTVLARSARTWLSIALLTGCVFLLIPIRSELWSSVLAVTSAALTFWLIHKNSNESLVLKTTEGRFAKLTLFIAPGIIVARGLYLYNTTGFLFLTIAGGVYFCARQLLLAHKESRFIGPALTTIAGFSIFGLSGATMLTLIQYLPWEVAVITGAVSALVVNFDLYKVSAHKKTASVMCLLTLLAVTLGLTTLAIGTHVILYKLVCAIILLGISRYGYIRNHTTVSIIGFVGFLTIIGLNVGYLWTTVAQTGWWGIAAGGAMAILAGSLIERAGTVVKVKQ